MREAPLFPPASALTLQLRAQGQLPGSRELTRGPGGLRLASHPRFANGEAEDQRGGGAAWDGWQLCLTAGCWARSPFLGRSTWVLGCPEGCLPPRHSSEPRVGCPSVSLGDWERAFCCPRRGWGSVCRLVGDPREHPGQAQQGPGPCPLSATVAGPPVAPRAVAVFRERWRGHETPMPRVRPGQRGSRERFSGESV